MLHFRWNIYIALVLAALLPASAADAHFLWLVAQNGRVHVYFNESPEPGEPELAAKAAGAQVWRQAGDRPAEHLQLAASDTGLSAELPKRDLAPATYSLRHRWGVATRGEQRFLLNYYAKTGPALGNDAWDRAASPTKKSGTLPLDILPKLIDEHLLLTVTWRGSPVSGAELKASGPGLKNFTGETDAQGQVRLPKPAPGQYAIRARHIEPTKGLLDGEPYESIRHYTTLVLPVASSVPTSLPDVPEQVTSFGAAIAGDALYMYGGHRGRAHSYSREAQGDTLYRLDLSPRAKWRPVAQGPRRQGLALVAHAGKLYRIGGFEARNADGEEHDLWSSSDVACYDTKQATWTALPSLPEPRSSFDAAVLDGRIYVMGGWKLAGDQEPQWHKTALTLDLNAQPLEWRSLPEPPFQRRALAVASHQDKLFAIGGMASEGGPTTQTSVFDPASHEWSEGPKLNGKRMEGFGASAFAAGGRLYVSTYSGLLQRLSDDASRWEVVSQLPRDRFFHRLLRLTDTELVALGGASMTRGKFAEVDVIDVSNSKLDSLHQ
ncbi:MAG: DUF1668 domain-containing protein [Planctomycetales bacterium]|nr:DUF1668 domain-containing protein [Planctomycetales bacterium]